MLKFFGGKIILKMDTKQVKERLEEITCNFCGIEKSVFSKISLDGEKTWDCIKCNAHYFQKMKSGQKNKRAEVIQDYAAMHDDSSMGCIIVFVIQGDIARKTARTLKSART